MDASEALLRGIALRLALLVIAVFVARNVPDGRSAEVQASDFPEGLGSMLKQRLEVPGLSQAGLWRISQQSELPHRTRP